MVVASPLRRPLMRVAVSGVSMLPAYSPGDWLLVCRIRPSRRARPGEVVVLRHPRRPELLLVKRVARVQPDGRLWVQGDNPYAGDEADDSRRFGAVAPELVLGRVLGRYWPLRRRRLS